MNQVLVSKNNDCEVSVSLSLIRDTIAKCRIHITNNSLNTMYVFNRIYFGSKTKHDAYIHKNNTYSYIRKDSILVVAKAIIPIPDNLYVEKNIVPYCSKISPQENFEEDIEINLPVKLFTPYRGSEIIQAKSYPVVFRFGYFIGHEQTESMEIKIPVDGEEFICFDPFDYNFQKIIEVGEFNPIPVK